MTLKSKLIATISAFCLVVGMLIAGVWASLHVQVEMGGDLIFTATDVNVRVSGKIEGMETTQESGVMTLPTITFSANPDENSPSTVLDQWKNNALTFTQAGDDITITITIENLNDRVVNVKVKDSVGESAGVDKIIKNGTTLENVAEVASGASVQLSGNSITYYTITLSLQNRNNSLATGVKYGYIIDLSDESYKGSGEVYSNNETLGTASCEGSFEIGQQVTLSANFVGSNAEFLGWAKDSADGEIVADSMEYTFTYDETSAEKYYAIFQDLNNSSLAYELSSDGTDTASVKAKNTRISGSLRLPSAIYSVYKKYDVTSIGSYAFQSCNQLTSITIPDSITSIGDFAFSYCSSITKIIIPSFVTSIGFGVLTSCSALTDIIVEEDNSKYHSIGNCIIETDLKILIAGCGTSIIPNDGSVISIGSYAFISCSKLTNVTIPDSVTSIDIYAFAGCSQLTSITIPDSVQSIAEGAFYDCSKLNVVTFNNKEGWQVSTSSDFTTSVIDINSSNLSNSATAAAYLTNNYKNYYWRRVEV